MQVGENSFRIQEACGYRWQVKFHYNTNLITVRVKLQEQFLDDSGLVDRLKRAWRDAVVAKWGEFRDPNTGERLQFELSWVTDDAHYEVNLHTATGFRQSDMLNWDTQDTGNDISHEFGHMVGLFDEYPSDRCGSRSPVSTDTVMDINSRAASQRLVDLIFIRAEAGNSDHQPPVRFDRSELGELMTAELAIFGAGRGNGRVSKISLNRKSRHTIVQVKNPVTGSGFTGDDSTSVDAFATFSKLLFAEGLLGEDFELVPHCGFGKLSLNFERGKRRILYPLKSERIPESKHPSSVRIELSQKTGDGVSVALQTLHSAILSEGLSVVRSKLDCSRDIVVRVD